MNENILLFYFISVSRCDDIYALYRGRFYNLASKLCSF